MAYRYIEKQGLSDVQFSADGNELPELFTSCWDAAVGVTIEHPEAVETVEKREIQLEEEELDFLLYAFLNEFVFEKDAEGLVLRVETVEIEHEDNRWRLTAALYGEPIDAEKHGHGLDIKAVTFHEFFIVKGEDGVWRAQVLLDV